MTIKAIVDSVLSSHVLTRDQESLINCLIASQRNTDADFAALDALTDALVSGEVILRR